MKNDRARSGNSKLGGKSGKPFRPSHAPQQATSFGARPRPAFGKKRPAEKTERNPRLERGERSERGEEKTFSKPYVKSYEKKSYDKKPYNKKPYDKTRPDTRKPHFKKTGPGSAAPQAAQRGEDVRRLTKDGSRSDTVLIWGLHAARAAWLNPKRKIHRAWLTEAGQKLFEATQKEAREELLKRIDAKIQERPELDRITPPGSVHQGIVIEVSPLSDTHLHEIIAIDNPPDLILMLDQVTDPHNVGAILRSAAAFGAGAIIMTERNAPTTTGVLAKSASGALEHTPMIHVVNLARALDELREAGYWCVGLAEEGKKELSDLDMSGRTVLVLGNEGEGLRHLTRQKCDELARLPTGGPIGSLNVSNAAAVVLYEARRQTKSK